MLGVDQLLGCHAADLRLWFPISKLKFSHDFYTQKGYFNEKRDRNRVTAEKFYVCQELQLL